MFGVELIVPFLFLMPRRLRILGAWFTIVFQLAIALTGNYTFFNLLTIVLCIPLFDDQHLYGILRRAVPTTERAPRSWLWATIPAGMLLIAVGAWQLLSMVGIVGPAPELFPSLAIVNRYGLFAVMTTSRPKSSLREAMMVSIGRPMSSSSRPAMSGNPLDGSRPISLAWIGRCGLQRSHDTRMRHGSRGLLSGCSKVHPMF